MNLPGQTYTQADLERALEAGFKPIDAHVVAGLLAAERERLAQLFYEEDGSPTLGDLQGFEAANRIRGTRQATEEAERYRKGEWP